MLTSSAAGSRWVEFAAIDNVRDLGGLPVTGGGRTRFGVVYRASTPQELTESDQETLLGPLAVTTLIDLRAPDEARREGHGRLVHSPLRRVNLPVQKAKPRPGEAIPDARRVDLVTLYRDMLAGSAAPILTAVRLIADSQRQAVAFHCAGGKDRTGILTAVLLDAVGVPAEAIVEDYALTAQRLERIRERLVRLPSYRNLPQVREGVLTAEPRVMWGFLAHLHSDHGGASAWLLRHGLSAAELARLHQALVAG